MTKLSPIIVCVFLSGCTMYHTIDITVSETAFKYYLPKAPRWTIQDATHGPRYVIVDKVEADAITVTPRNIQEQPDHNPHKKSYWKHYGRYTRDHFHLTVPGDIKSGEPVRVPFSDIQRAQTHEIDAGPTVGLSVLTAAGYVVGGGFTILLIACNCPRVSVQGKETPTLEGALFPGAISKSLSRNDNLLLNQVPLVDGNVKVRVSNELPETEYIDRVELFELSNLKYSNIALTQNTTPVAYEPGNGLISAVTGNGNDIQKLISGKDDYNYAFDEFESDDELNKVTLKFSRPEQDKSMLVIRARQSPWIETVGEFFFQQFGDNFSKWVGKLDKTDPLRYNQTLRDRGISMNAYVKVADKWKYVGSFDDAGTIPGREIALPVDHREIAGDIIEIKLEAAHGFWEIDRVELATNWNEDVKLRKLKTLAATNNEHKDVLSLIASTDGQYLLQPEQASFVDVTFEAPSSPSAVVMLGGTGYYHHLRNYKTKPNYKLLRELNNDNITTHQLSRLMKVMQEPAASTATVK